MDCFGLGGYLVRETDIDNILNSHKIFCKKWKISDPLHSTKIRGKRGAFSWIGKREDGGDAFYSDIGNFLCSLPIYGIAAIIHRPGYNKRYREKYGDQRWMLCKTAYAILIERAAKFVLSHEGELEIYFEAAGKKEDTDLKDYTKQLKSDGMPFDKNSSSNYASLKSSDFSRLILGDARERTKKWPPIQIADLVLYALAKAGYDPAYAPYAALMGASRLIDSLVPEGERQHLGTKYSCFESN